MSDFWFGASLSASLFLIAFLIGAGHALGKLVVRVAFTKRNHPKIGTTKVPVRQEIISA